MSLWKLKESGAQWVYQAARFNPFTYAVEWIRYATYDKDPGAAPWIVLGTLRCALAWRAGAMIRSAALAP